VGASNQTMNKATKLSLVLVLGYLASWLVAYAIVMGSDFGHVVEYFKLGWSFSGGEYPAFIWLVGAGLFVVAVVAVVLFKASRHFLHRAPNKALKMDAR
jgi:hypothetical protein